MTLPASGNSLSLSQIQTEFGGSNPIGLNEYYAGGSYVPSGTGSIASSGAINMSSFFGTSALITSYTFNIASVSSGDYNSGAKGSTTHYWNGVRSGGGALIFPNSESLGSWSGGTGTSNEVPSSFHTVQGKSIAGKEITGIYNYHTANRIFGPDKGLRIEIEDYNPNTFLPVVQPYPTSGDQGINHGWSTMTVPNFGTLYNKAAIYVFPDNSTWYGSRSDTGARVLVSRSEFNNGNHIRFEFFNNLPSNSTGSQLPAGNSDAPQSTDMPSVGTGSVTVS